MWGRTKLLPLLYQRYGGVYCCEWGEVATDAAESRSKTETLVSPKHLKQRGAKCYTQRLTRPPTRFKSTSINFSVQFRIDVTRLVCCALNI